MTSFHRYQAEFTGHIRDPKANARPAGTAKRGMDVYAEIVFNNMEETLSACFPVIRKVLGVRRWKPLVRTFLAQHRCATPWFRQIPEEFLRWLETEPEAIADLPPFLASLAHYEWMELAIAVSDATLDITTLAPEGDLLDGIPVLAPALALLQYPWPVHRISPRFKPVEPPTEPVHLLVFRDADDEVLFNELNPVSARLIGQLQSGNFTGRQALEHIATELLHPDPQAVIRFGADLLHDLRQQGAVWGSVRPSENP